MQVVICDTKADLGRQAARQGAQLIRAAIAARGAANIIVATGASQFEMLHDLALAKDLDWSKVTGFHLDEYIGMPGMTKTAIFSPDSF